MLSQETWFWSGFFRVNFFISFVEGVDCKNLKLNTCEAVLSMSTATPPSPERGVSGFGESPGRSLRSFSD